MKLKIKSTSTTLSTIILFILVFLTGLTSYGFQQDQEEYLEFRGTVVEENTKKPLPLASIAIQETNISTISNTEGEFSPIRQNCLECRMAFGGGLLVAF